MRYLLRLFRNCLSYKRIDEKSLNIRTISVRAVELSYFNLSTNVVTSFEREGRTFYFRECPPILPFRAHFIHAIDRFFAMLNGSAIDPSRFKQKIPIDVRFDDGVVIAFREYLDRSCEDPHFIKRLSCADMISQKMNFSIWDEQKKPCTDEFFRTFGMEDLPPSCDGIAVYFLWYMRGVASLYRIRNVVRGREFSWFSAVRSVATKLVADAVGLGHMIPQARPCRLVLEDGSVMLGVLSDAASGDRMADAQPKIDGSLQRELTDLNVLDLLCFQPDHGVNNYNLYSENGEYRVCAFDNDNPNTFLPFPGISHNFLGCSPVVSMRGRYNRPYIDVELLFAIQNLNTALLKKELKPYLNFLQIFALICRLKLMRKQLAKSSKEEPRMAASCRAWIEDMLTEELSGKYGKTYLTIVAEMRGK